MLSNKTKFCFGVAGLLSYFFCGAILSPPVEWQARAQQPSQKWTHDAAHCKAIFRVGHDSGVGCVTGWFNKMLSSLEFDGKNLATAKVRTTIFTESLTTGSDIRDRHLKTDHFFDVEKYPSMKFRSSSITPVAPGKFKMTGELEIKGRKKTVTFDCVGPKGPVLGDNDQTRIGVIATTKLNRKDFDVAWNREVSPGIFMVGDDVDVTLEMEYLKGPGRSIRK